jgi:heptaprenyl diphosphate synthase
VTQLSIVAGTVPGPERARDSLPEWLCAVDPALAQDLAGALARVERRLASAARDRHPTLSVAAGHLLRAGGKRLRPLLALLAARFGPTRRAPETAGEAAVAVATLVELIHAASLYHDDVMDQAPLRRGVPSANARWGDRIAVLAGDFLMARAAEISADLGNEAVAMQVEALSRLVRGQVREAAGVPSGADPVEHCLHVMADKTAALLAMAAGLGATVAGADPATARALSCYGEALGVAFQLADDIRDVTAESTESGKLPGTDLRQGLLTLPVLLALREGGACARVLREVLTPGMTPDPGRVELARYLLARSAGLHRAQLEVARRVDAACAAVGSLPPVPARRALEALCGYVRQRAADCRV